MHTQDCYTFPENCCYWLNHYLMKFEGLKSVFFPDIDIAIPAFLSIVFLLSPKKPFYFQHFCTIIFMGVPCKWNVDENYLLVCLIPYFKTIIGWHTILRNPKGYRTRGEVHTLPSFTQCQHLAKLLTMALPGC